MKQVIHSRLCSSPGATFWWWTGPNTALGYLDVFLANLNTSSHTATV